VRYGGKIEKIYRIGIEMENIERNMKDRDGGKEKSKGRKIERKEK